MFTIAHKINDVLTVLGALFVNALVAMDCQMELVKVTIVFVAILFQ